MTLLTSYITNCVFKRLYLLLPLTNKIVINISLYYINTMYWNTNDNIISCCDVNVMFAVNRL